MEWTDKIKFEEEQKKLNYKPTLPKGFNPLPPSSAVSDSESVLWKNELKTGFIHRKVIQSLSVTDYYVVMEKKGEPTVKIPISTLSDVVVMNVHREGHSYHTGYGSGRRYYRTYGGFSTFNSRQVGTVVFMVNGVARLTWNGVQDPQGLRNLVRAQMKRYHK